jgi:DNA ligase D-like protein (predicted ligase)
MAGNLAWIGVARKGYRNHGKATTGNIPACVKLTIVGARKIKAGFIEPMLLLRSADLPDDDGWLKELKLDGYRALAIKSGGKVELRSRNDKDFTARYAGVAKALTKLPDETVIDGEIVAVDEGGRPSFNILQNYGSSKAPIFYYVFDLLVLAGEDVMGETLDVRRSLLEERVLHTLADPIRYSPELRGRMADLVQSVKAQGLEGLVAKRRTSIYEPGGRSGAWRKMRINQGQEFVIGGYTVGGSTFDALVYGSYEGEKLIYAARTRNGFTPRLREELMKRFRALETDACPFTNLPEAKSGRWGEGLTAAKMAVCRWLIPTLVAQFEFTEWTPENHLRHSRFIALREDGKPGDVRREIEI